MITPSEIIAMDYDDLYRKFRWQVPEHFNFAVDVIDQLARDRSRIALLWEDDAGNEARFTFADISAQSSRFANALRGLGIRAGDPVMIMLPRAPEWFMAFLGALKAGALVIPCTASLRAKDIRYRAQHSGARAIVTAPESVPEVEAVRGECDDLRALIVVGGAASGWRTWDDLLAAASSDWNATPTRSDEPAICFYTSGTTKDPKAVLHTHAYTFAHRYTGQYWLDLRPGELHWTTSDTGWAKAAYGVLFGPWNHGTPVLMYHGRFEPEKELRLLEKYGVTVFCAPPTEYRLLVKEDLSRFRLPRLRHCTGAGEPLNPEVIHAWKDALGLWIHDGYGQTESIIMIANLPGMPIKPGSMGKPFPGHDIRVIDEHGTELPAGEVGDLALRCRVPSLFREYWKNPAETAACWRGEWYVTGDRASRDDDGYLWFVGRADDVIISAGYRIGPFEVESALLEHPAVVESAVVASPHAERGAIVKAFVKLRPGITGTPALVRELQEHVKRVTAPYKYPREIEFIDELPKTVSGKIRRVELRQREEARTRTMTP
ncbi:MAG TPA: acyl--CoA ligase [Candidatus Acidoferrales bacterium]|nr:acyl--CoA ligase [Candidatus Acidoferrales bacterium]